MMFTERIPASALERMRIEPEFYDPEKIAKLSWMSDWQGRLCTLESLCAFITDGTHVTPAYQKRGVKFLSSTNIEPLWIDFDNVKFISPSEHAVLGRARCNPQPGDILLSKNGRIGTAAVYRDSHEPCSLFVSVALLRYSGDIDREFVTAFLNCRGGWFQFTRASKTGVITNLHLEEIREVLVPKPSKPAQLYIGEKVRQAERLRERARNLESSFQASIKALYPDIFGPVKAAGKSSRAQAASLDHSLNPGAYNPERLRIRQHIEEHGGKQLSSVARIETPVSDSYQLSDTYIGLDSISSSTCGIAPSTIALGGVEGAVRVLRAGPVISKLRPYLKKTTYIPQELAGAFGSTELLCVFALEGISGWFLYGVLKLESTIRQLNPIATGSTHPRVSRADVLGLMLPWAENQDELGERLELAQHIYFASERLITAAKLIAEALIEGRITETELMYAQEAIERGDMMADRELLSRLTRKGIDMPGEPPLIPDLDALYNALEQVADADEQLQEV